MTDCPCPKHPIGCYGHPTHCGCADRVPRDLLVKALETACGNLINAKIDLDTGHTKAQVSRRLDGIIKSMHDALVGHVHHD